MNETYNYLSQWLSLSEGDLASAKHLLTLHPYKLEVICYLCEQSAEKMLKGFLASEEKEIPKTHDLMKLCRLCMEVDIKFDFLLEPCSRLMPYGVQVRYPNHTEIYEEDMRMALKDAEKIMDTIQPKIQMIIDKMEEKMQEDFR
ncbi:HEPN domain-containing protein [Anaerosporobacter sp.]|uniref:HEPN domain-containing protein n=1 Tax=Anaerosporobacter sp. TaxID=1872529 RepID=UPI00286F624C|nr:HEPN domain-containing protein [Anaerosporobacter sp.]